MSELKVDFFSQNVKDKAHFLKEFMRTHLIRKEELGYIGDWEKSISGVYGIGA